MRDAVHQQIHGSACSEYGDSDENCHQVGNDHDSGLKTFLGSFHKRFVSADLFVDGQSQKNDNHAEKNDAADKETRCAKGFRR